MLDLTEFTRLYLALFFTFVAAFYAVRITLMKRTMASEVVFAGKKYSKSWCNHMTFRLFRGGIWGLCLLRLAYPSMDNYLGMITSLVSPMFQASGILLLSIGFIATSAIHFKLGDQWRSGIDPKAPSKIITNGVYRYSRNPMYVSVAAAQLGFFLALPCYFTLICLLVGLFTLNSQAKVEESHLKALFPKQYAQYSSIVRRWI
ncbi:isoprenylcysteine carboxylmethyltransferase family protein [Vibrio mediterranei]|uniref:methyltransferase family protein n=1 Tax=Vibrio mediterranei TaxID=689 RepID=UPI001EFC6B02|nr:isoprenylcysteine carboxylmethyltransferase family protein [Vibrio mediterranei]MCG9627312.1 isoprenylcysteine carboxylmethyltransferase family protein [Vibrio mediterranei]